MAFQPFMLGASALSLDGTGYEGEISGAIFTPTSSTVPFTAINGTTWQLAVPTTWVLEITYAQDWAEASSLSRYLHDNEGSVVPAIFEPIDGGPTVTADVTITPGAIGGDTTAVASGTVTLGSTKPVVAAGV